MRSATEEIIHVCESLSPERQTEVADFARFLLAREDDREWEQIIADPQGRPKLDAFVRQAIAEGSGPLDVERL